ncbi:MFS transporter [Longirhabdus pacifica]|uniref:MFS transporter n=1 Tax=Longirhabdus pacifica TaxID=2305227 RepID=UPI0010091B79|nr:MFS transporter [Longirhabdus pacifica]
MFTSKNKKLDIIFTSEITEEQHSNQHESKKKSTKKSNQWLTFLAFSSIPIVLVLGNSMLIPILPKMKEELSLTQLQTSLVITLFSVTAAIFIPVLGYLSDRYSRKAIIIPCLIIYGSAGIVAGLGALWQSYTVIFISRIVQGLGAAGTAPIAMALVGDLYKGGTESKALGLIEAANGTGKVLSPILGSLLALIIWYAPFFAFPIFCCVAIFATIWLIKEPNKSKKKKQSIKEYVLKIGSIFKEKGKWLIPSFIAGSLSLFILFGVLFYLSDILEKKPYNFEGTIKGFILAIPLLGLVITSYITGSVIKKNGVLMRILINVGLLMASISLVITIFFHDNMYVFISLLTISSVGTGLLLPCLNTMVTGAVDRQQRGMITSLYSSLRFFGVAAGPPLIGWLMSYSHQVVFIFVSVVSFATLIMTFFFIKPSKKVS